MAKKPPTKAESDHMAAVAELGCLCCGMPAQIHHVHGLRFGARSHWRVAPLCYRHHHMGAFGHCVHNGVKTFEENYMTQEKMLSEVNKRLNML